MSEPVLDLTAELIRRPSVTPDDAGCQELISARLEASGYATRRFDMGDVKNLLMTRGSSGPLLLFVGHTDVVPPGPESQWTSSPFEPCVRNDRLYGRGAADMKGSVAAMVVALERYARATDGESTGRVGLLLTSDEEGPALDGIRRVAPQLEAEGLLPHYCLVGEPSSLRTLGDNVRIGRRGSLNIELTIVGRQGHAAYPELAKNPIHAVSRALHVLTEKQWDQPTDYFPATSFQITHLEAGTGVYNVIPGQLRLLCNFRYAPGFSPESLVEAVKKTLEDNGVEYDIQFQDSGRPFLTEPGTLVNAVSESCQEHVGVRPKLDTGGGTSDGRFLAPLGADVVELGPVNASIHQVDEWVDVDALPRLGRIYESVMSRVLSSGPDL